MALKVAIVGCGKVADAHVTQIRALPSQARLVAVADHEPLMADQLAARFDIPARYGDVAELLERERPDVLHIATPPASHLAIARQAIAAGCHLLVEKPLAPSPADTVGLLAEARAAGRLVAPGYSYWFEATAQALREAVEAGRLGRPVHIEATYSFSLDGAFGTAALADPDHWIHSLPGGLLHNQIDHLLSALLEFVPDGPLEVHAVGTTARARRFGDRRDLGHDGLSVQIRSGATTAHGLLTAHGRPQSHRVRVTGDRGTAEADYVARTLTAPGRELPSALGRLVPAADLARQYAQRAVGNGLRFARNDFGFFAGLRELLARFYRAVEHGGPPPVPYQLIERVAVTAEEIWGQLTIPTSAATVDPAGSPR